MSAAVPIQLDRLRRFPNRTLLNHESARSGRLEPSTIIVRLVRRTHASCVLPLANRFRAIRMDSHALAKGRRQVSQGSPAWKSLAFENEIRLLYRGVYAFQTLVGARATLRLHS